jgi:hypothetical protein
MGRDSRNFTQIVTLGSGWGLFAVTVVADLCAVAIFVLVGRSAHDEAITAAGVLRTSWPFVIGVLGGYIGTVLTRWPPISLRGAAVIAVKTVVIGLVLRYGVQRDGTPLPFVAVTVVVLTALMFGWRLLARIPLKRGRIPAGKPLTSR